MIKTRLLGAWGRAIWRPQNRGLRASRGSDFYLQALPEVYSLLIQHSIIHDTEEALRASDQRQHAARNNLDARTEEERSKLDREGIESAEHVSERLRALRAENEGLLVQFQLQRRGGDHLAVACSTAQRHLFVLCQELKPG